MIDYKVGFVGSGNMAHAIMKGVIHGQVIAPDNIHVFDIDKQKLSDMQKEYGIHPAESNVELAEKCDMILLAVKPGIVGRVLEQIKNVLRPEQMIVSIAAGWSTAKLRVGIERRARVLKVMPNTPAMVGAGVMVFSKDNDLDEEQLENLKTFFSANGLVLMLEEDKMFATTGISGTIPACVSMYIEALADGGVSNGLTREFALQVAAQAVMGSAKMVLESEKHPGILKDQVCTPAGTTIEAVVSLEEDGFRGTVIRACNRCTRKSYEMLNK